ncbi:uncharacterized protein BCR38DRAFT_90534 [Pseudomassariella vexata]|uniref:SH3 domain-containing protein n=1 Tax=Pseudomassariella vexata TaxID=1141098 RepID=A0A1Y2EDP2_9PEZI|nr:uncharacterized protein BCR38DRAFT_90534 [Pseudomassariella vexata]ORY69698.1 hypothetical protein BCR38DRAFT_90534 [Pseudomassariella vexata]
MTRPQIIRADSIDLQDPDTPSAKNHTLTTNATTNGQAVAPHQAETLREVAAETADERRVSWANADIGDFQQYANDDVDVDQNGNGNSNSNGFKMQQQDTLAMAQNGGGPGNVSDNDDMDADGDDMDDDMMDKISSSPSIEDGGYTSQPRLPPPWPARVDSLRAPCSPSSPTCSDPRSSSPYLERPGYLPIRQSSKASVNDTNSHHHLPGEYTGSAQHESLDEITTDAIAQIDELLEETEWPPELDKEVIADLDGHEGRDSGRDSALDMQMEDASLDRSPSKHSTGSTEFPTYDESDDDLISPYGFLIPYVGSEDDDDDDFPYTDDSRFVDSGWGGECLQDSEDIDFEFVYALHTFVATVEGQANATKGDTMVLLDDSNSYWWLVRIVKDSSIGYLPAEHIETPTERLARLNKHRNIDLSATMLGDQAEKTKNPLKSAMRRKKGKTVTFTAPTYVDYSDFDYSSDEDDVDGDLPTQQQAAQQQQASQRPAAEQAEADDTAKVEPLKPRGQQKQLRMESTKDEKADVGIGGDALRNSDEIFERPEGQNRTTRNGTVRNTDSFFKDETVETKKISLTPNLLRDDNEPRLSNDSKEVRQRPSLDKLEKELVADKVKDKKKDKEKKEKDKKGGIRSFFSRKDKKKSIDDDNDSFGKRSLDASIGSAEGADDETQVADADVSPEKPSTPDRNPSKLRKAQPRAELSPTRKPAINVSQLIPSEGQPNNVSNNPTSASLRMVESDPLDAGESSSPKDEKSKTAAISKILHPPPKVSKAKSRIELDDFDSSEEEVAPASAPSRSAAEAAPAPAPATASEPKRQLTDEKLQRPTLPGSYPDSYLSTQTASSQQTVQRANITQPMERLSESPVQVSPTTTNPPALMGDTSSQEDRSSPISSPSPELVDTEDQGHQQQDSMTTSTSATTTSPSWNDTNLRAFFDSGSDIRDLLVVVYDKTDVPPAGPDHPVAGTLFRDQNAKLAEITTQLDNMLGDWLARKQRLRGSI